MLHIQRFLFRSACREYKCAIKYNISKLPLRTVFLTSPTVSSTCTVHTWNECLGSELAHYLNNQQLQMLTRYRTDFCNRVPRIAKNDCLFRHVRLPICLFVRTEQLGSHLTDFHEIFYMGTFRKCVEKYKFYYNLTTITDILFENLCKCVTICR